MWKCVLEYNQKKKNEQQKKNCFSTFTFAIYFLIADVAIYILLPIKDDT